MLSRLATLVASVALVAVCVQAQELCKNDDLVKEKGRCIWFGQCAPGTAPNSMLNCYDNNPARDPREQGDEFYDLLVQTCPQYANRSVCCDLDQLNALATQTKYPQQLFSRCPACLKNFMDHFCATTCDPDQALFILPTICEYQENFTAIAAVNVYVTDDYAEDLYRSCSNVQYPQASNHVLDLMCGATSHCNSTLWLDYLGDNQANPYAPFQMKYIIGSDNLPNGTVSRDYDFMSCNTSDPRYQCSCADCGTPDLCPEPHLPKPRHFPRTKVQLSIVGVGVFLSVVLFFASFAIGAYLFMVKDDEEYAPIVPGLAPSGAKYKSLEDDSPTSSVGSVNADDVDLKKVPVTPPRTTPCLPCYISGAHLENFIKIVFYHWGLFVARFWYLVIIIGVGSIIVIMLLTITLHVTKVAPFLITTDPVKLWSAPTSRARQEKDYFDAHFGPFYRSEMIIITAINKSYSKVAPTGVIGDPITFGPVFDRDVMLDLYEVQNHLQNMEVNYTKDDGSLGMVTLSDICFKPLNPGSSSSDDCAIMSVLNYFQNNYTRLTTKDDFYDTDFRTHLYNCVRDPTMTNDTTYILPMPCLGAFGGPIDPNLAVGGFNKYKGANYYQNATALIVTFTVNNHVNDEDNQLAKAWEKGFLDYIQQYRSGNMSVTYSAERSIEDELTRESKTDIFTVAISYFLMFAYITIFLGHIRKLYTIAVDVKIIIGLLGVLMVLMAVVGSICLLNLTRIDATLIIIEVVPFLVLAVGVDNLFIIVHSFERESVKLINSHGDLSRVPHKEIIGRTIAEVAPSLLLTSLSETAAFLLGGVSTMPAVRTFSFYAGVAVFINFLLQVSVFLAALSLDAKRQLDNRFDVACCIRLKGLFDPRKGLDIMHTIMTYFANIILHPFVRPFVVIVFCLTSTFSLASLFNLQIGLDQNVALPKDSYLNNYFEHLFKYLHTGSPVYFVIKDGYDYTNTSMQAQFCSGAGCNSSSIGTEIFAYSRNSSLTSIAEPPMLWLDTYFEWIVPRSQCCGKDDKGNFCLYPQYDNSTCHACISESDLNENGWPKKEIFYKYIHWFLNDNPGVRCPSGGHAAFKGAINFTSPESIRTSYVMTYHTIMTNSSTFIAGLKSARALADTLTATTGVTIFPYSVFYVYYEQYLTTVHDFLLNIGLSLLAVFVVTFLLMGFNLWAALIIILVVVMIIVHMLGCMAIAGINGNAVSLVNLVMTVGIAVEFCSHIVRWFCSCSLNSRIKRAHSALAHMGASVVSGITLTKLLGVFVLFFAKSQIFEVYYFRMYMFMLLWGALHGLVFLPVLLSFVGPSYVPIKVRPPYRTSVDGETPSSVPKGSSQPAAHPKKTVSSKPSDIQQRERQGENTGMYPSLPNVGTYDAQQQGYPQPTYPRQQQYQAQGQVYQPSETTKLLSS